MKNLPVPEDEKLNINYVYRMYNKNHKHYFREFSGKRRQCFHRKIRSREKFYRIDFFLFVITKSSCNFAFLYRRKVERKLCKPNITIKKIRNTIFGITVGNDVSVSIEKFLLEKNSTDLFLFVINKSGCDFA